MMMERAVSAEDERSIGRVVGIEFVARENVYARYLERPDDFPLRKRSQHGDSAHGKKGRITAQEKER